MAASFYLDASALAKRYVPETGSPLVDEILDKVPGARIYVLNVGAGEVVSILVRKKNAGMIRKRSTITRKRSRSITHCSM